MTYRIQASVVAMAIALMQTTAAAQQSTQPALHVNPKWKECSFQLDPSLTQSAWRQFTREAGLVTYFRPLADARPMGRRHYEVSLLQWQTGIDDEDAAWNDTFVHPDSAHWLFEGSGLQFPGLMLRAGVTDRTDVGLYATKAVGANYGFYALQLQRNLVGGTTGRWASAARASFVSMYGPDDLTFTVYGVDLLASRRMALARWATVSPYAGISGYLATSHEKSRVVNLEDERVPGLRGSLGAELRLWGARLGAQYDVASVRSLSFKIGVGDR